MPDNATAILTIDLRALAANYNLFQKKVGSANHNCKVAGIVKANAYGLGMKQITQTLTAQNCSEFFVATPDEALKLRELNKDTVIYVLCGLFNEDAQDYIDAGLIPVLNSLEQISIWQKTAQQQGRALPAIIHFDTGMNRLGLGKEETRTLLAEPSRITGLDLRLIMSHFACADEKGYPLTTRQAEKFATLVAHFPKTRSSLANSSGLFRDEAYHYNLVRPGMALYGLNPTPEADNPMQPVIKLESKILQIRNVTKDDSVGYGASHIFARDAKIATLALGYADGFLRSLGNSEVGGNEGVLYYQGKPCPIVGRVSMDLVTVDISKAPEARTGDMVEIIGPHQSADDLAADAGTIGYEILTNLGNRYHRHYIS